MTQFTTEDFIAMGCAFARQASETTFTSCMSTFFKVRADEYNLNLTDYVGVFKKFMEFSESEEAKSLVKALHSGDFEDVIKAVLKERHEKDED